jgi:hypothetical protein
MELNHFQDIFVALLSTNHKCTHPCKYSVQKTTLRRSTSVTTRKFEACDNPVTCLWKMKMISHRYSYRCSCKDLRVYPYGCNKVNKPLMYVFEYCLVIFHFYFYHMCEILILTHMRCIWFSSKKRVWHYGDLVVACGTRKDKWSYTSMLLVTERRWIHK